MIFYVLYQCINLLYKNCLLTYILMPVIMNKIIAYLLPPLILTIFLTFKSEFSIVLSVCFELIAIYLCIGLVKNRIARVVLWMLYLLLFSFQVNSIMITGGYILPLTIMNLSEASALGKMALIKMVIVSVTYCIMALPIYLIGSIKHKNICSLITVSILLLARGAVAHSIESMHSVYKQLTYVPLKDTTEILKKFHRTEVYHTATVPDEIHNAEGKNIVVIFTEGLSSQVVDSVNQKGLSVTPTIDRLFATGFVVDNYFNHTAATFRGLRGQLISGYQYKGGYYTEGSEKGSGVGQMSEEELKSQYAKKLISLPQILNNHGYTTSFIASTQGQSNLNNLLRTLQFTHVYGMENFDWNQNDRMSDKRAFEALRSIVEQQSDKFFIGIYPSGTHHGLDSQDHKYGNGSNAYYNKFHDFDIQLGHFLSWFEKSPYFENTLVILTTDHATFPATEYLDAFDSKATSFVDKIPLVIFGKDIGHAVYDAKGSNSLDLAPTILNLLGIQQANNYFLGCSLFEISCHSKYEKYAALGDSYFHIQPDKKGVYRVKPVEPVMGISEFYHIAN